MPPADSAADLGSAADRDAGPKGRGRVGWSLLKTTPGRAARSADARHGPAGRLRRGRHRHSSPAAGRSPGRARRARSRPGTTIAGALKARLGDRLTVPRRPGDSRPATHADVGIVVLAEPPYAEGEGDSATLALPAATAHRGQGAPEGRSAGRGHPVGAPGDARTGFCPDGRRSRRGMAARDRGNGRRGRPPRRRAVHRRRRRTPGRRRPRTHRGPARMPAMARSSRGATASMQRASCSARPPALDQWSGASVRCMRHRWRYDAPVVLSRLGAA